MAIAIPMSRIYGEIQANLINNNAIDNVQFDLDRQVATTIQLFDIDANNIFYTEDKGLFIIVGRNTVAYSTDGITFTTGTIPEGEWFDVTYAKDKGMFVAVGYYNNVAYSYDGKTFNKGNIPTGNWQSIAYAEDKGMFVAVGEESQEMIAYSYDGITFYAGSINREINWYGITYAKDKGMFVAVGHRVSGSGATEKSGVAYSTNGINFTQGNIPFEQWQSITYSYNKGLFVAVGNGAVAYSQNGQVFTKGNIPTSFLWYGITYAKDKEMFVAVGGGLGNNGAMSYSYDGLAFIQGTISLGRWEGITYAEDKGMFVAVGFMDLYPQPSFSTIAYSTTGTTFTNIIFENQQTSQRIGQGNNPFKITGNELLNTNTTYNDPTLGVIPMTQYIANNIISKWKDGRMSVNFTCDYTKYLDEYGNATIYTGKNGELLRINETIVLWDDRMNRNEPLIKDSNGNARQFSITSNEMNYEGAIMQTISALEVAEPIPQQFMINIERSGQGVVNPFGQLIVNGGEQIIITATPSAGASFQHFSASQVGHTTVLYTQNPLTLYINNNTTVIAVFRGGGIET